MVEGALPGGPGGAGGAPFEVGEGDIVGGDEAGAGARLDAHVADGHAALHGEGADDLAAVLDDVAGAAAHADGVDDGEDDVLGGDAGGEFPVDLNGHGALGGLGEGLGGEHVLDLGGADADGERAEGAVGGGVAIAADDGHAGLAEALLGADHVNDALAGIVDVEERHLELGAVGAQGLHLLDGEEVVPGPIAALGGDVVIDGGEGAVGAADGAPGEPQGLEGLGRGDLVDEVEIDVEEVGEAFLAANEVLFPDLLGGGRHRFPQAANG